LDELKLARFRFSLEKSKTYLDSACESKRGGKMGFFSKKSDEPEGYPAELSEKNFEAWIQKNSTAVVMVYAPGCGHCKKMEPTFKELADQMQGRMGFGFLNAPGNQTISYRYDVSATPTFLFFKNGALASSLEGEMPKEELGGALAKLL
jgi:thioredoxin 1